MAWNTYRLGLAVLLVITGSINTISTKWADGMDAVGRDGEKARKFNHPFLQALGMFLGEALCWFTFKILYRIYSARKDGSEETKGLVKGARTFNPLVLMIPAMCDMIGTSIMYIGLNLTYASSFQMFRGSVIIFVGLLSVAFLGRRLKIYEWFGMFLVMAGLIVVGISDFFNDSSSDKNDSNSVITGDLLIIAAQVITATQMVVEEKFVAGLDIPALQAVGWEGIFGFLALGLLQIPFYFIWVGKPFSDNPRGVLEDVYDGFIQMGDNKLIILALIGTIISIAFFNFAGISVTKEISATTRMVLDSVRTLIIWLFSLAFFHQEFKWLQLLGFVILLYGMFLYNGITLMGPFVKCWSKIRGRNYDNVNEESVENHPANQTVQNDNVQP